jgi:transposase, IS5 family
MSYRTFTRLADGVTPKKSSLQATIRSISPETLEKAHQLLMEKWLNNGDISCDQLRVDSTVVKSNITPPSDSQLLNDAIRVLSRHLAKSGKITGIKIAFTDKRKAAKSLAFRIFNAKKPEKDALYPEMLNVAGVMLKQVNRTLLKVEIEGGKDDQTLQWLKRVKHYKALMLKVIDQTQRRVLNDEKVPCSEKIVSMFEEHTDIIVKRHRETRYGHKVNLSSEENGFITYFSIEDGNPSDSELFLPVLEAHQDNFGVLPTSIVADGGYAGQSNVTTGREMGVKRVVFHKRVGLSYLAMGVKEKTFNKLKHFRAGVEGNISELKRVYGAGKALWKGLDGFKAFVWSSVLSYNLVRMARQQLE